MQVKNDTKIKISYEKEIISKLASKLNLKNKHEVPRVSKIILNMGLGEDASDSKKLKACVEDMSLISVKQLLRNLKSISILKQDRVLMLKLH